MTTDTTAPEVTPEAASNNARQRDLSREMYLALQDALKAEDVPQVQALVPGLTKNEAHCLTFHTRQQAAARLSVGIFYGHDTWGQDQARVPAVVLAATRTLRVAGLLALEPWLSREEALRIVECNMASEVERGCFWRWPVGAPSSRDLDSAMFLANSRHLAARREAIHQHGGELGAAHEAALQVLEACGLKWEHLDAWHKGERGEAGAVERQAQVEAERLVGA